jgi:hypothetical protein
MKKLALISTVLAALLLAAVAVAALPQRDFSVSPRGGSKVKGTGTVKSVGAETGMTLALRGLPRDKKFRVVLNTGTCAHRTAGTLLGIAAADKNGVSRYSSLVRRNGAPIAFKSVADGKHVIVVVVSKKTVACGPIPA